MTISEIEELISLLGSFGVGAIVGGAVIYFTIRSFIPSYLSEKAKNLATKEDIETITDKIESVKAGYAEVLEEIKSNNQLKIAAVEREKATKKEVYMDAVEAITRSQNMVASLANLSSSDESITSSLANDAGRIAKVQIVGSKNTVKAVTRFSSALGPTILNLMLERSELMQRQNSIKISERCRDKASQELDRYIELMKNLNLEGNKEPHVWKVIEQDIEFQQQERDRHQSEIGGLSEKQIADHLTFAKKCMDSFFELSELLPEAILSVRHELDLDIADDDYLDIFNESIAIGRRTFEDLLGRIKNQLS